MEYSVKNTSPLQVVAKRFSGSAVDLGQAFIDIFSWLKDKKNITLGRPDSQGRSNMPWMGAYNREGAGLDTFVSAELWVPFEGLAPDPKDDIMVKNIPGCEVAFALYRGPLDANGEGLQTTLSSLLEYCEREGLAPQEGVYRHVFNQMSAQGTEVEVQVPLREE